MSAVPGSYSNFRCVSDSIPSGILIGELTRQSLGEHLFKPCMRDIALFTGCIEKRTRRLMTVTAAEPEQHLLEQIIDIQGSLLKMCSPSIHSANYIHRLHQLDFSLLANVVFAGYSPAYP
jgi:hypothetical protein